jgi:hypothetical protein
MVDPSSQNKNLPEMPIPENVASPQTPEQRPAQEDVFVSPQRERSPQSTEPQTLPNIERIPETPAQKEQREKEHFLEIEGDQTLEGRIEALKQKLRKKKKQTTQVPIVKDELTIRIEKVMEDGLGDAFLALTPIQKQEFKIKGEETAWQIRQLMKKTHIKIKEIFRLIYEWLKILPGINKFFLEQEAKIKADKIISLKNFHNEE